MDHPSGNLRNQLGKPQVWFQISQRKGTLRKQTLQINCEYAHSGEQWRKLRRGKTQTTGYIAQENTETTSQRPPNTLNSYTILVSPTQ